MEIASHSAAHLPSPVMPLKYFLRLPVSFCHVTNKPAYLRHLPRTLYDFLHRPQPVSEGDIQADADFCREALDSKRAIESRDGSREVVSYVYPYGRYDRRYEHCVKMAGYSSARGTLNGYNTYRNADFFDLKTMIWRPYTTPEEAKKWVTSAVKKNAWLIETLHLVTDSECDDYPYTTPLRHFRQHVESLPSLCSGLWIDTQMEIAGYMLRRRSATTRVTRVGTDEFAVELSCAPSKSADRELTIKVKLSSSEQLEISQGAFCPSWRDGNYICFNAFPNKGVITVKCKA
jgi:hypothetical protein